MYDVKATPTLGRFSNCTQKMKMQIKGTTARLDKLAKNPIGRDAYENFKSEIGVVWYGEGIRSSRWFAYRPQRPKHNSRKLTQNAINDTQTIPGIIPLNDLVFDEAVSSSLYAMAYDTTAKLKVGHLKRARRIFRLELNRLSEEARTKGIESRKTHYILAEARKIDDVPSDSLSQS